MLKRNGLKTVLFALVAIMLLSLPLAAAAQTATGHVGAGQWHNHAGRRRYS